MADLNLIFEENPLGTTPYNERIVANKTTLIELKSIYGLSALRDQVTEIGTGSVTNNQREYSCNVTGASSRARLSSAQRGRYISGKSAEYGIGVRTSSQTVTGDTVAKWGALNDVNGMYFGVDSTGIFVAVLDNEVENKIYQSNWNTDKLDGTGESGVTLDTTKGNIYNISFTWYGYGVIDFKLQIKTVTGNQTIIVHRYIVDGATSIENPNLPITSLVEQNTATNNFTLFIGGRQFSVIGSYTPSFRSLSDYVISKSIPALGTNPTPIISFKQKASLLSVDGKFSGINIGTNNAIIFEAYIADESQLTGASFGTPLRILPTETAFEVDKTATAFDASGGNMIYRDIAEGSDRTNTKIQKDFSNIVLDIPENKILVICAFAIGATASVDTLVRIREEW